MRLPLRTVLGLAVLLGTALYAQRGFRGRGYLEEDNPAPIPPDDTGKTEFIFTRLRYPSYSRGYRFGSWATDYPKADRQFLQGVRAQASIQTFVDAPGLIQP